MGRPPKTTPAQLQAIAQRVREGETIASLATEYGYTDRTWLSKVLVSRFGLHAPRAHYHPQQIQVPDDPAVRGYLAGLFDGEGSIIRRPGRGWTISLASTDAAVIQWLMAFGGGSYAYREPTPPRKPVHLWRLNRANDARAFLTAVLPYLIIKRDAAVSALAKIADQELWRVRTLARR